MIENRIERVIILSNTLKNGGAEKQSILLAQSLKGNYDTNLIVYYGSEFDEKLKQLSTTYGISVILLNGSHIKKSIFLYKLFKKNSRTVIFSYLATANIINATIGSLAGVKFKIGGIRNSKISISKTIIQKFLHNYIFTYTIFNNVAGKNELCGKGFKENKSIVIHNGIDIRLPKAKRFQFKRIFNIISVGRFVEQKDYFTSINAIAQLLYLIGENKSNVKIKYTIVGYGYLEKRIRRYISEMNLIKDIEIIINPPDISEYLSSADIYLSTSLYEGLSNSIMEAMENSLPIVATNVGDNDHLIHEGFNGFLVPIEATEVISARLFDLINDNSRRAKMGFNSYNLLKENYSIGTFKQNYIDLINKCENESKA